MKIFTQYVWYLFLTLLDFWKQEANWKGTELGAKPPPGSETVGKSVFSFILQACSELSTGLAGGITRWRSIGPLPHGAYILGGNK